MATRVLGPAGAHVHHEFEVFFDGDCPLCVREIRLLERLDRKHRILFTDIAASDFDPSGTGRSWQALMDHIHGRLPDGTLVEGVEVFRRLYTAVGFGPLVALTRLPVVAPLLDLGYRVLAKNRLRLPGRCADGTCRVEPRAATDPASPTCASSTAPSSTAPSAA